MGSFLEHLLKAYMTLCEDLQILGHYFMQLKTVKYISMKLFATIDINYTMHFYPFQN